MQSTIKIILSVLSFLTISLSYSQDSKDIVFEEFNHDFGEVTSGDTVSHLFKFVNNTGEAIQILDVITQCGCTSSADNNPEWIESGKSGELFIVFDSNDKEGFERKTIKVKFSDFSTSKLVITANVLTD